MDRNSQLAVHFLDNPEARESITWLIRNQVHTRIQSDATVASLVINVSRRPSLGDPKAKTVMKPKYRRCCGILPLVGRTSVEVRKRTVRISPRSERIAQVVVKHFGSNVPPTWIYTGGRDCYTGSRKPMRILIVEDEKRIQDFLSRGLESAGYAVDAAGNGANAVEMVHGTEYDLIILDLMLPDTDGLSVLQKIRNRKSSPPVLILSARDAVDDRVKGLELGADDYLTKPFAFVELLARARALLRRGQPTPERLQVGELLLDCIRRKVTRANENIELAPKEFSILEYMMRNRGRPLSRTMIVEHVWDMDYDGLTNIVDVYIRHLRSKIDDKFPLKMIHTVRGIGYMLDIPEKAEKFV